MAAIDLALNTPDVATISTARQRYNLPPNATHTRTVAPYWVRIYSAAECYLELVDAGDGTALGADFETIPAGTPTARVIRRGEFCISGSAAQDVEVTVAPRVPG